MNNFSSPISAPSFEFSSARSESVIREKFHNTWDEIAYLWQLLLVFLSLNSNHLPSLSQQTSDIPADAILELFGKTFFEFCQDSGYDKILQVLGATPRDFLQVSQKRTFTILMLFIMRSRASSVNGFYGNSALTSCKTLSTVLFSGAGRTIWLRMVKF